MKGRVSSARKSAPMMGPPCEKYETPSPWNPHRGQVRWVTGVANAGAPGAMLLLMVICAGTP
jgi:hypothetical protein